MTTYQTNAFSHGIGNSAVASNWANRPDDERFFHLMICWLTRRSTQSDEVSLSILKMNIVGTIDADNPSAATHCGHR